VTVADLVYVTGRDNPDLPMESCPHDGMRAVEGVASCDVCGRTVRQLETGDVVYVAGDETCAHLSWVAQTGVRECACGRVVQVTD
jgi:hypothetical protein